MGALADYSGAQLRTIKNTVAADTNQQEFDLFLEAARSYGLDPFRRQISAIVFSKDNAQKRRMAIIVGRDGLRSIAQRCGDYRPASKPADFDFDESLKGPANPHGIVRCGIELYKRDDGGQWFPVYGEAYWDEFAPVTMDAAEYRWEDTGEVWPDTGKPKKRKVPVGDVTPAVSGQWAKMPRLMIQKCAEAQALRAGWPDSFSGLYAEEEMDQARAREMKDITPSEAVEQENAHRRQNALGKKGLLMVMDASGAIQRVPLGEVADRCMEFIKENDAEAVYTWSIQNTEALREFWAEQPQDALAVKKEIEAKTAKVGAAA